MKHVLILGAGRIARPPVKYLQKYDWLKLTVVEASRENLDRVADPHPRTTTLNQALPEDIAGFLAEQKPDVVMNLLPTEFRNPVAAACLKVGRQPGASRLCRSRDPGPGAPGEGGEAHLAVRTGRGSGHRPHVRGEDHQRHPRCRRTGAVLQVHLRRHPVRGGQQQPLGLQAVLGPGEPHRRLPAHGPDPGGRPGPGVDRTARPTRTPSWRKWMGWAGTRSTPTPTPCLTWRSTPSPSAASIFRGTIRYLGWCETIVAMNAAGPVQPGAGGRSTGLTFREFTARRCGADQPADAEAGPVRQAEPQALFGHLPAPEVAGLPGGSADPGRLRLQPRRGARALRREAVLRARRARPDRRSRTRPSPPIPDGRRERHTSTLIDFGIPNGDSSIARTTGLPPAIVARLFLEGRIPGHGTGAADPARAVRALPRGTGEGRHPPAGDHRRALSRSARTVSF